MYKAVHGYTILYKAVYGWTSGLYITEKYCTWLYQSCTWLYKPVHDCTKVVHGCKKLYMGEHGCTRLYMAVHGCTRMYKIVHGCTKLYMAVPSLLVVASNGCFVVTKCWLLIGREEKDGSWLLWLVLICLFNRPTLLFAASKSVKWFLRLEHYFSSGGWLFLVGGWPSSG